MEGAPHRTNPAPDAYNLTWFLLVIMIFVILSGILIAVFRNLH